MDDGEPREDDRGHETGAGAFRAAEVAGRVTGVERPRALPADAARAEGPPPALGEGDEASPPWAGPRVIGPAGPKVVAATDGPAEFLRSLPDAFAYPFRGQGWVAVAAAGVLLALAGGLQAVPFVGLIFQLVYVTILLGYLVETLFHCVLRTAEGQDAFDEWPDFTNAWDSAVAPLLRLGSLLLAAAAPACLLAAALGKTHAVVFVGLGLGALYLPMTLIAWLCRNDLGAMNPIHACRILARAPAAYLALCLLVVCISAAGSAVQVALAAIPFAGAPLAQAAGVYGLLATARLLGLFLRTHATVLDLR